MASGCAASKIDSEPQPQPAAVAQVATPAPRPPLPDVMDLTVYQFSAPEGSISQNAAFWNLAGEDALDLGAAVQLDNNGIRIASANVDDWPKFKAIFDKASATALRHDFLSITADGQDFAVTGRMHGQTLFVYDSHGLSGANYDDCENLFSLSYAPVKNGGGAVHVELCPVVRGTQKHYVYTVLNDEESVELTTEQHIYDLNLQADLLVGRFLIVSPSAQAARTTSVGHQFLTQDGASSRRETVFIFVANRPPGIGPANTNQPRVTLLRGNVK